MFRFLAKSALATVLFKRYRRTIISTLLLFAAYFFISMIHGDYVSYATSADDKQFLWISFLLKWALLIGLSLLYYFYNARLLDNSPKPPEKSLPAKTAKRDQAPDGETNSKVADPFEAIRQKDKLQTRGDVFLKNSHKKQ
ncbi:MAG TPA: hypothetical protein VIC08_02595 [Cellvibrionaceae bacterium]